MSEISLRQDLLKEVADALPRAASLFSKHLRKEISKNDIYILDHPVTWHFDGPFRDRHIEIVGPTENLPPINRSFCLSGMHSKDHTNFGGLCLHRASTDKTLLYIVFNTIIEGMWNHVGLIPKGLVFRYKRHIDRVTSLAQDKVDPPILEAGLLDRIVESSIGFLVESEKIEKYKVRLKKGLLLGGPPGNGKTMACKWLQKLCHQNNIGYTHITSPQLEKGYKDNNLCEVISQGAVTFFDDIDVSFLSRSTLGGGDPRMACAFAAALDGFGVEKHMVRIFTTNEDVTTVDAAFKRPGRIDQWFNIEPPSQKLRLMLIRTWHSEIIKAVKPLDIATQTESFSFADLEAVKSALVINKIFRKTKGWDLGQALKDFLAYKPTDTNKYRAGFAAEAQSGAPIIVPPPPTTLSGIQHVV